MKFGKELLDEAREEWRDKYINYIALKKKLSEVRDEVENPHANPGVLEAKRAIFQGCLDSEIEKVITWYKSFLESLEANAKALERDLALAPQILTDLSIATDFKHNGISTLRARWRALGTDLAHLLEFVSLNMIAMRKILKKFAKHVEPTTPMDGYCTLEIQHPDDPAWAFVQGTFLPDYIAEELDLMQNNPAVSDLQERVNVALGYLQMIRKMLIEVARDAPDPDCVSVTAPRLFATSRRLEREASVTRQQTLNFTSVDEQHLLRQIEIAANQARVSACMVRSRPWSVAQAGIFEEPLGELLAKGDTAGICITLSMAFLHACVYYVPTPTLHHLCKDLNISLTYGGLVFAISDIGEIIASFGYTFWTNNNYKHPLLFSACCGVLGCSLTSLGLELPFGGVFVYLTGRFLIGAASARTICRRYVADCIPVAQRTFASIGMVVASSMGMGIGSLISVPIERMGNVPLHHNIVIEPISFIGWVGGIAWLACLLAALCFFTDPYVVHKIVDDTSNDLEAPLLAALHGAKPETSSTAEPASNPAMLRMQMSSWTAQRMAGDDHDWEEEQPPQEPDKTWQEKIQMCILWLMGSTNVPWNEFYKALRPTMCLFVCLSLLKLSVAVFSSSLPLFSHGTLWYWKDVNRACVLGYLALTMIPAGYFVGFLSTKFSDRRILVTSITWTTFACGPLYLLGSSTAHKIMYIFGGVMLHMSVVGVEGSSMSLISKVIHPCMARGAMNCGLLTTVAGTVGRLWGNIMVLVLADIVTVDANSPGFELVDFAHVLYGTLAVILCANVLYVLYTYRQLR
mmetsp:Transcript_36285/g.91638  ORF Transcript_36285/g.91638 Transcript_36285/m.91638 type:complete len:802 (+) Transcript_36285:270-2675(+)